jgi:hypothetical protein
MRALGKNISVFLIILFAAYFALYSISPVCYAGGSSAGYDYMVSKDGRTGSGGLIVVWKLLLTRLLASAHCEDDALQVNFIIKKARAVISPQNILKENVPERTAYFQPRPQVFFEEGPLFDDTPIVTACAQTGLYVLFSGPPPPSV